MFLLPTPGNLGKAIRRGAPWMAIIILHTTSLSIQYFTIQKLMETFPTFMVICLAMFCVPPLTTIGRLAHNGAIWIAIICIHPILFGISALHRMIQISIIKTAMNFGMQTSILRLCLYWLRFYYSLFKCKQNRKNIQDTITRPLPPGGTKARRPSNIIFCLDQKSFCFSLYQIQGAYARLDQRLEKDLDEAVAAETVTVFMMILSTLQSHIYFSWKACRSLLMVCWSQCFYLYLYYSCIYTQS